MEKKEPSYDWEVLQAQSKQANFYYACTLSRLRARARLLTHVLSSPSHDDAPRGPAACRRSALWSRGASSAAAGKHRRKQEVLEALIALDRSSFGCAVCLGGGKTLSKLMSAIHLKASLANASRLHFHVSEESVSIDARCVH